MAISTNHYTVSQPYIKEILVNLGSHRPSGKQIKLACQLFSHISINHKLVLPPKLSAKQTTLLILIARGFNSAKIGELLNIKKSTVETHRKHIKSRLNCLTIAQAIYEGITFGLLPPHINQIEIKNIPKNGDKNHHAKTNKNPSLRKNN